MRETPAPFYSLINTTLDGYPAVVVVNTALRTFDGRDAFPWHLRIVIACRWVGEKGMPNPEEVAVITRLGECLEAAVEVDGNAVFLARITVRGERVLLYRVHDPEQVNDGLQHLLATSEPVRAWQFQMEYDLGWNLARPELDLPLRDSEVN